MNASAQSARTPIRAVLFDLDGTLLDTAPDLIGALNELRAEEGLGPVPFIDGRGQASNGANAMVKLGFGQVPEAEFEKLRDRYLAIYRNRVAHETKLFPGGEEMLAHLDAAGLPWGIVTNKPAALTEPLLAALGLDERARCVVSGDTLPERKPHPRPLLYAAECMGVPPAACVYVGDALRDIEAARAAGMRAIVASFGYICEGDDCRAWPAEHWLDDVAALVAWLKAA